MKGIDRFRNIRLKRRIIPYFFSSVFTAVIIVIVSIDWIPDEAANEWTALYVAILSVFQAILFAWMRRRMRQDSRKLTVFGYAIVDFFTALVLLSIVFATVYTVIYWYAIHDVVFTPFWARMAQRAAIGFAGTLIVSSGIAVAREMRQARGRLMVHEDAPFVVLDPAEKQQPEQKGGSMTLYQFLLIILVCLAIIAAIVWISNNSTAI